MSDDQSKEITVITIGRRDVSGAPYFVIDARCPCHPTQPPKLLGLLAVALCEADESVFHGWWSLVVASLNLELFKVDAAPGVPKIEPGLPLLARLARADVTSAEVPPPEKWTLQ